MPRDVSKVYSAPAGTKGTPNATIESAKYNALVDDLEADLNLARPIVAGGTGATSAANARTNLGIGNVDNTSDANKPISTATQAALNAKQSLSILKNVWINGNMDIWQKGPSMAAPAAIGGYQCDFFGHRGSGSTVFVERKDFTLGQTDVPGHPRHFLRCTVASVAGAANYALMAADIDEVGTFSGSSATLTFYAKADAAKDICIEWDQHFGGGGTPSADWFGTPQTVSLTTAWQRFDVRLENWPSIAGKVLGTSTTDTDRIGVVFYLDAGSDLNARTNSLGQQNITFDIARVSLRQDPDNIVSTIADPILPYSREVELSKCQTLLRVFDADEVIWSGPTVASTYRWLGLQYGEMRRTPVVTLSNIVDSGFSTVAASVVGKTGTQLAGLADTTQDGSYFQCDVIIDANHPYTP